jgi:hypothetical protein
MDTCLECHQASPCRQCHLQLEDPRYRPDSHDAFWLQMHGKCTRKELESCADCHRDAWCQDCHQGDVESRYHDVTFRVSHGLEVRLNPGSCQTCHTTNFCQNCHASLESR